MKRIYFLIICVFFFYPGWSQQLSPIKKGKKVGYSDAFGNVVVPPQYSAGGEFNSDYTWLNNGGKAKEKLCPVGGKWGVMDSKGKIVVPVVYDFVDYCVNGYVAVNSGGEMSQTSINGGKWGIIDLRSGEQVIPIEYDQISPVYEDGVVWAFKGNGLVKNYMYFDEAIDKVRIRYFEVSENIDLNLLITGTVSSGGWKLLSLDGKTGSGKTYDAVASFYKGYARVCKNGKWGVISSRDSVIIPFDFENVSDCMSGNRFWCLKDGSYQLYSTEGRLLTDTHFRNVGSFTEDEVAWVNEGDGYYLIDLDGNQLTEQKFYKVYPFSDGVSLIIYIHEVNGEKRDCLGMVNSKGKLIAEPIYSIAKASFADHPLILYHNGARVGFIANEYAFYWIDSEGNQIAQTKNAIFQLRDRIPEALWDF